VVDTLHKDCIPQEVLRGKIMATKVLVKKQAKAVKQVETEIMEMIGGGLEGVSADGLEQIARALREFYICIENALGFIGHNLDGGIPNEENVNQLLLDRMSMPLDKVRPAVIDKVLRDELQPYMEFRLDLEREPKTGQDRERIGILTENLKSVSAAARQQLTDFFVDINKYHGFE